jgi:hypothetical protein
MRRIINVNTLSIIGLRSDLPAEAINHAETDP